jgi:hypothetical protein
MQSGKNSSNGSQKAVDKIVQDAEQDTKPSTSAFRLALSEVAAIRVNAPFVQVGRQEV